MDSKQDLSETVKGTEDAQTKNVNAENVMNTSDQTISINDTSKMSEEKDILSKDLNNKNIVSDSRTIEGTEKSVNDGAKSVEMNKNEISSDIINNCFEESSKDNLKEISNELHDLQNTCEKLPSGNVDKDIDFSESKLDLPNCQSELPQSNLNKSDDAEKVLSEILDETVTSNKIDSDVEKEEVDCQSDITSAGNDKNPKVPSEKEKENEASDIQGQSEPVGSSDNILDTNTSTCESSSNLPVTSDIIADSDAPALDSSTNIPISSDIIDSTQIPQVDTTQSVENVFESKKCDSSKNILDTMENIVGSSVDILDSPSKNSKSLESSVTKDSEHMPDSNSEKSNNIPEVEEMETEPISIDADLQSIEKNECASPVVSKDDSDKSKVETEPISEKADSKSENTKETSKQISAVPEEEVEKMDVDNEPVLDKINVQLEKDETAKDNTVSEENKEKTSEPIESMEITNVVSLQDSKENSPSSLEKMETETTEPETQEDETQNATVDTDDQNSKDTVDTYIVVATGTDTNDASSDTVDASTADTSNTSKTTDVVDESATNTEKTEAKKPTSKTPAKESSKFESLVNDTNESAKKLPESFDDRTTLSDSVNEDDRSMDDGTFFVHVSSKSDKNEPEITNEPETVEDSMEVYTLPEEDPIGVSLAQVQKDVAIDFDSNLEKQPMKVVDKTVISDLVSGKGADEELCIIPDTERVISQEEKDAATKAKASQSPTKSVTVIDKSDDNKSTEVQTDAVDITSAKDSIMVDDSSKEQDQEQTIVSDSGVLRPSSGLNVILVPADQVTEQLCQHCSTMKRCLYTVTVDGKEIYLCDESCAIAFKTAYKPITRATAIKLKDMSSAMDKEGPIITSVRSQAQVFVRECSECQSVILDNNDKLLTWETMEFCNEECLTKYQTTIGSNCANCKKSVAMSSLGKYCVRFGHDIRQFCCSICLEEFKKGLKVCSYCQKDISAAQDGFLAPVGDKGQFKDFCSQGCMENYDIMNNRNFGTAPLSVGVCSVCLNEKELSVCFENNGIKQMFCSDPCFVAFKFVNNVDPIPCDMCKKHFDNENNVQFSMQTEAGVKNFCCKTCQNIHIISNRRIVPCSWCKVKKYNFDMIKKVCQNGQVVNMCSLNCLSLFQVSVNAVNAKRLKCDFCQKMIQAQYHLTMSDATLRNFCSYQCVISFQNQFPTTPLTFGERNTSGLHMPIPTTNIPIPSQTGPPRRNYNYTRSTRQHPQAPPEPDPPLLITNVQSLASISPPPQDKSVYMRDSGVQVNVPVAPIVKQQVIMRPHARPTMKNKMCSVRPITKNVAIECTPKMVNKEIQTDPMREKIRIIPIPVPIYVPTPLHMFSRPLPVPVPFPLPVPVPIFIPTTRNSAAGIMKEIKKIQVKIPTDPFEAELLMMAEMVAGEKKIDNTDSESDDDDRGGELDDGAADSFSPEAVDTSNTFGDDMLQMALKMATELDEPAVDLEGALTANTITASQTQESTPGKEITQHLSIGTEESVDDQQPLHGHHGQMIERTAPLRGRKRQMRSPRAGASPAAMIPSKRGRRMSSNVDMPMMPPPQPQVPAEPVEKPDANMCLKYTFGVNAWKQWVTTKNAELEKSSRRMKLFKNEILQLTADELNYSLCLFVKEVRKPNGTEYAPDTIYYLCLGIQQYLFENGRIDNIFTDPYYEKFTDCLDEVAKKFSVLYNDSHYIVTRVEEEHLWESKQLGAHSPHVLLSTLMFFNTKHFNLTTVEEHMSLSFSHIMKHWKRNPNQPGAAKVPGSRNVLLRFYPPQPAIDNNSRKKKVYEQQENEENPLRCPVKLYEFYLSKCPESVKTRNDVFYLLPERSCVPDSPVWYSTMALGREALEKMLHRVKMVKEINVALLTS